MYGIVREQANESSREQAGSVETHTCSISTPNHKQKYHVFVESMFKVCAKLRVPGNCPMCMVSETLGFGAQHGPTSPWAVKSHLFLLGTQKDGFTSSAEPRLLLGRSL